MPVRCALGAASFVVCLVGVGTTFGAATGIPVVACAAALFTVNVVILWRDSLDVTVALAVALGFVSLVLIVTISIIAFAHPAATGATRTARGARSRRCRIRGKNAAASITQPGEPPA